MENRNNANSLFSMENKFKPRFGPRQKSTATIEYEKLIKKIVNPKNWNITVLKFNSENELVCYINTKPKSKFFNVTQILKHRPDLEHLSFDEKTIANIKNFYHYASRLMVHKFSEHLFPHLSDAEKIAVKNYTLFFYTVINDALRKTGKGPMITMDEILLRQERKENIGELKTALEKYIFKEFEFIVSNDIENTIIPNYDEYKKNIIILSKEGDIYQIVEGQLFNTGNKIPLNNKEWSFLKKELKNNGKITTQKGFELMDHFLCKHPKLMTSIQYVPLEQKKIGPLTFLARDFLVNTAISSHGLSKHFDQTKVCFAKNLASINLTNLHSNTLILVGPTINPNVYEIYLCSREDIHKLKTKTEENFKIDDLKYGLIDISHKMFSDEIKNLIKSNSNHDFIEFKRMPNNYMIVDNLINLIMISYENCDLIQFNKPTKSYFENLSNIYTAMESNYAYVIRNNKIYFFNKIDEIELEINLEEDEVFKLNIELNSNIKHDNQIIMSVRQLTGREIDEIVNIQMNNKLKVISPLRINQGKLQSSDFIKTEILYRYERQNKYMTEIFLPDLKKHLDEEGYKIHFYDAYVSTSLKKLPGFGTSEGKKPIVTVYEHTVGHGKNIAPLSQAPHEEEILFLPGTQILIYKMDDQPDGIYIYAKVIRSLDNILPAESYSSEQIAIREKYIEMKNNLKLFFRDFIKEYVENESRKIEDYRRSNMKAFDQIEEKYFDSYQDLYRKCEIMIDLLSTDHSSPDLFRKVEKLNLEIYSDLILINKDFISHCNVIIDLLPLPLRLIETFNHYPFDTAHKTQLKTLKNNLKNLFDQKFNNDEERILNQSVSIFAQYFNLLQQPSAQPSIFGSGSSLAQDIRKIIKNIFAMDLPAKLNNNQLTIKLSEKFKKMLGPALKDEMQGGNISFNINSKDTFDSILQKLLKKDTHHIDLEY